MSDYYILITDAGKALEAAAHASSTPVKLTDFAVGDGGGVPVTPDASQTALVNETYRDAISSLTVSPADVTVLEAECVIPASSGGYTIREIGIFADDGTLYAVGNFAEQEKPDPDSGYSASLQIFADLAVSDTSDITLSVQDGTWLTETQANTIYLRQDMQLGEIKAQGETAQQAARDNLRLGTAATANVTTSTTDTTAGNLLKVGDYGLSQALLIATGTDLVAFLSTATGSFYHCDTDTEYVNAPQFGGAWFDIYMTIHESTNYRTMIAVSAYGQLATAAITNGGFSGWYIKGNAVDYLPLSGGDMTGEITGAYTGSNGFGDQYQSGAPFYNVFSSDGTSSYHPVVKQQGSTPTNSWAFSQGLLDEGGTLAWVLHMIGSGGQSVMFQWNTAGQLITPGQVIPGDYSNFDASYQRVNTAGFSPDLFYHIDTNTGYIRQGGLSGTISSGSTIYFPIAFTSQCVDVVANRWNADDSASIVITNKTLTGFSIEVAGGYTGQITWSAEGQ